MARNTICVGVYRQFVRQSRKTADLNDADERSFPRGRAVLARPQFNGRSFVRIGHGPGLVGFELGELDEIPRATGRFGARVNLNRVDYRTCHDLSLIWIFNNNLCLGSRSEELTSELQSLMRNSYAVVCLIKKNTSNDTHDSHFKS